MKKDILFGVICICGLILPSFAKGANPQESVVKVFVTTNRIDYNRPWQTLGNSSASGTGFVIEGKRIITNAHVVNESTFIQVRKESSPKKYTAKVVMIGQDCDLAILSVEDPDFFTGVTPLTFGSLPKLQDAVTVVGFPMGGDKISVTEGVVSRVEIIPYAQSGKKLLGVQIDAAINPGNSGGPVLQNGKVVGVAMQMISDSQNIGYMIPSPIINHFLKDIADGIYAGFPSLGIEFSSTENLALKRYYKAAKDSGGVLISWVVPYASAEGILAPNDVLLSIDNIPLGEDGTFEFRSNERLALSYLVTAKQIGDDIELKILRDGKILLKKFQLRPSINIIPFPHEFDKPPYYIYGGMVFTVLSVDLLMSRGQEWWKESPTNFLQYLFGTERLNPKRKKEVVILLEVLPDDVNVGYHAYRDEVIRSVNGHEFESFLDFVKLIESQSTAPFMIFETDLGEKFILDTTNIQTINKGILIRNNIPRSCSEDVEKISKEGK